MLNENIKKFRQAKGLSQEELALKINVVRQTVSKWEKGLSVPDAQILVSIADALDTSVADLLDEGTTQKESNEYEKLATKLEILNEQIARRGENRRKSLRIFFIVIGIISALAGVIRYLALVVPRPPASADIVDIVIGGADGPTAILVATKFGPIWPFILIFIVSMVGFYLTRRR